jgi:hypothetical protein
VDLRPARIAVFAYLGREKALSKEMENYLGESYEAPVLAAALRQNPEDSLLAAQAERFILHSTDPGTFVSIPLGRPRTWVRDMPNCSGPDDYMHKPNMPPH